VTATEIAAMIAKPSIAFNDFAGTAGDVTSRSVHGRTILSHKAYQDKTKTPAQAVSRNALAKISRAYKQLTDSQMRAWETLAGHLKGASLFGEAASMTGHNAFVRLNSNRAYIGEDMLTDAPAWDVEIPQVRFTDWCISEDYICFTGVEDEAERYLLVAKMSDAQSAGISAGYGKIVIISPDKVPDWGDIDLTAAFSSVMGGSPINGKKYFIELYWIDSKTGITGIPARVSGICQPGSQISGETFGRRIAVHDSDLIRDEYDHMHNMSVEFAPGSTICTVDAEYNTGDYNVASGKAIITKEMSDRFPNFRAYVAGRRGAAGNYWPCWYEVNKWKWGQDYEMNFSNRGGLWNRVGLVFGTSPAFQF